VVFEDEETFGLALRTFEPWIQHRSNFDILEAELDPETVANFSRLADRVAEASPPLRSRLLTLKESITALEGHRIRDLLGQGESSE
jgi:hypothetical protein